MLKRPTREPRPPARRAYAPEGTEKKPIVFRSRGVMQRSHKGNRYVPSVPDINVNL
ncbi:MAG: hypothetical protein ACQEQO_02120 [Thermodesulfobacteriota bacterium]